MSDAMRMLFCTEVNEDWMEFNGIYKLKGPCNAPT